MVEKDSHHSSSEPFADSPATWVNTTHDKCRLPASQTGLVVFVLRSRAREKYRFHSTYSTW